MNIQRLLHPKRIMYRLHQLWTDQAIILDVNTLRAMQDEINQARELTNRLQDENARYRQHLVISDNELRQMQPPVFIFGPPRSGSTFLVEAMNTHENIYITNELRVMSFINDLFRLYLSSNRIEWNLSSSHKDEFLQHFRRDLANLIKRFYLIHMPSPNAVWGDKHPHYSDDETDPGVLDTILELFPDARFIHIYRHPREQIFSIVSKGWHDFKQAVLAYRRIVTFGKSYGAIVGPNRYLEIKYEDLCSHGERTAHLICNFLGIPMSQRWLEYMRQQEMKRTPFSDPITGENEIGQRKNIVFSQEENEYFEQILGEFSKELGYQE